MFFDEKNLWAWFSLYHEYSYAVRKSYSFHKELFYYFGAITTRGEGRYDAVQNGC